MDIIKYLPKTELIQIRDTIDQMLKDYTTCRQCMSPFDKTTRSWLCKECKHKNDLETRKRRYHRNKAKRLSDSIVQMANNCIV